MSLTIEICAEGATSALAACAGGADRVELCSNLAVGGITPSAGAIALSCAQRIVPVHVLVRPRGGDYVVSETERLEMRQDIQTCKQLGAKGVVLGCLTRAGEIDRAITAELVAVARPLAVTFHRAFDCVVDPFSALETLIELGIERVLTSGRGRPARDDLPLLGELARLAGDRITILAGGSVGPVDLYQLAALGLREAHIGTAATRHGKTDADRVRRIMAEARRCEP